MFVKSRLMVVIFFIDSIFQLFPPQRWREDTSKLAILPNLPILQAVHGDENLGTPSIFRSVNLSVADCIDSLASSISMIVNFFIKNVIPRLKRSTEAEILKLDTF